MNKQLVKNRNMLEKVEIAVRSIIEKLTLPVRLRYHPTPINVPVFPSEEEGHTRENHIPVQDSEVVRKKPLTLFNVNCYYFYFLIIIFIYRYNVNVIIEMLWYYY